MAITSYNGPVLVINEANGGIMEGRAILDTQNGPMAGTVTALQGSLFPAAFQVSAIMLQLPDGPRCRFTATPTTVAGMTYLTVVANGGWMGP